MATLFPERDLSTRYGRLSKKADDLCNQGDDLSREGKKAESRRTLRECRRYRDLARQAEKEDV